MSDIDLTQPDKVPKWVRAAKANQGGIGIIRSFSTLDVHRRGTRTKGCRMG